jgi:hypothetical protein
MRSSLTILVLLSLPACSDSEGVLTDESLEAGCPDCETHRQLVPAPSDSNFVLYVSNQSFEIDPVDIAVEIDGKRVVEGDFLVEGQHSWHVFKFQLEPGQHTLRVVTDVGESEHVVTIETGEETRYGVLNFWFYGPSHYEPYGPGFSFDAYDVEPTFG